MTGERRRQIGRTASREWVVVLLFSLCAALDVAPAAAQEPVAPSIFREAQASFERLPLEQRFELQMLLVAAGYGNAVSNEQFSKRLFATISRFELENGFRPDGTMGTGQVLRLRDLASPLLRAWRLQPLAHPAYPAPLWLPAGLGLAVGRTDTGYQIEDRSKALRAYYNFLPGADLRTYFDDAVSQREANGFTVDYKVLRGDFFAAHGSKPLVWNYIRYQTVPGGLLGFSIFFDAGRPELGFDRLVNIMSDLFRANVQIDGSRRPPELPGLSGFVAWQTPDTGFGQGAVGTSPPSPTVMGPAGSSGTVLGNATPPSSVVVTLPNVTASVSAPPAPAPINTTTPTPEPVVPASPNPPVMATATIPPSTGQSVWQADGRTVELLRRLRYVGDATPPSQKGLEAAVADFALDYRLQAAPRGEALLVELRRAAREGGVNVCRTGAEGGSVCVR